MIFKNRKIIAVAACMLCMSATHANDTKKNLSRVEIQLASKAEKPKLTDRIIIKYKDSSVARVTQSETILQFSGNRKGLSVKKHKDMSGEAKVYQTDKFLSSDEMKALITDMKGSDANIEYAEPDRIMEAMMTPTDTNYTQQWNLFEATAGIAANLAWDITNGTGVKVAVIDTGVRRHIDLAANLVGGYDFISNTTTSNDGNLRDTDPLDPGDWVTAGFCATGSLARNSSWHGTHVAGTIAAVTNNGRGVAGIAYGAKVVPVRVLGRCGGYTSDIADAIVWASGGTVTGVPANANPAKVLNLSLGGAGACDVTTQNAINSARSRGATVVVAAGNSASDASLYSPASCQGVVVVGAVGRTGAIASYSNFGSAVDLSAPGGDGVDNILSTLNTGTTTPSTDSYASYRGTSMATPHVAATVALMLAKNPALTPDQIETKLKETASYRGFPLGCNQCGTGILNSQWAVQSAMGTFVPPTTTGGGTTTPPATLTVINEVEPNNTQAAAQTLNNMNQVNGIFSSTTDKDLYKITLPANTAFDLILESATIGDYDLYLYYNGTTVSVSTGPTGNETISMSNSMTSPIVVYAEPIYYSGPLSPYKLTVKFK